MAVVLKEKTALVFKSEGFTIDMGKLREIGTRPLSRAAFLEYSLKVFNAERAMAQGYYTLEEAAKVLGMSAEKLNKMAQDPRWLKDQKVNAFRDPKVVWRFRVQDIDALSGQGQALGEASAKGPATPSLRRLTWICVGRLPPIRYRYVSVACPGGSGPGGTPPSPGSQVATRRPRAS